MGVLGLGAQLKELQQVLPVSFLKGSDIYIDALNFSYLGAYKGSSSTFDRELTVASKYLGYLRTLQPRSLTFVADAAVSLEKFKVRREREVTKMARKKKEFPIGAALFDLLLDEPDVSLIFSGAEGEDEIMKLLDEDTERGSRKQIVVTSDSDIWRFRISNMDTIYIVSPQSLMWETRNKSFTTTNLGRVAKSGLVKPSLLIPSPIERPGRSFVNPRRDNRSYCELLNCANVYNRIFRIYSGYTWDNCHMREDYQAGEAGLALRRLAYGLLIRDNNLAERPGFNAEYIEEWRPCGRWLKPFKVRPLEFDLLEPCLELIRQTTLAQLVRSNLEHLAEKYAFTKSDIDIACDYVSSIERNPLSFQSWTKELSIPEKLQEIFGLIRSVATSWLGVNEFDLSNTRESDNKHYRIHRGLTAQTLTHFATSRQKHVGTTDKAKVKH